LKLEVEDDVNISDSSIEPSPQDKPLPKKPVAKVSVSAIGKGKKLIRLNGVTDENGDPQKVEFIGFEKDKEGLIWVNSDKEVKLKVKEQSGEKRKKFFLSYFILKKYIIAGKVISLYVPFKECEKEKLMNKNTYNEICTEFEKKYGPVKPGEFINIFL